MGFGDGQRLGVGVGEKLERADDVTVGVHVEESVGLHWAAAVSTSEKGNPGR